jgi:hypothetical protein
MYAELDLEWKRKRPKEKEDHQIFSTFLVTKCTVKTRNKKNSKYKKKYLKF